MKYFILHFFLATLVVNIYAGIQKWPKEEINKLKKISVECRKISNVSLKAIQDMRQNDIISDSPAMKKHLGCIANRAHLVKDNGEIDTELFSKKLELTNPKDEVENIVEECAMEMANPDETGYFLIKCTILNDSGFRTVSEP